MKRWTAAPLILAGLFLQGCASTPKEVVELSYRMGEDLAAVHKSYLDLVHERFDRFRAERLDYLNNTWKPAYIKDWTQRGRLADIAAGKAVWAKAERKFVDPTSGKESEQLHESVQVWARNAIAQIQKKQKELLDPLDKDEKDVRAMIDDSFGRLYQANAAITAHLNSLRKVQEVQDQALAGLKVKDVRDKVNQALIDTSERAKAGLEQIQKADQKVDRVSEILTTP